jgi:small subunit ribosomal protein S7
MSRSNRAPKRIIAADPVYNSRLVAKLINQAMRQGKKNIARKRVYRAFEKIEKETKQKPLEIFSQAIENVKPSMEVRPRRIGGAAYQVPIPVRGDRKESLAIRWLIRAAQKRPNKESPSFDLKLAAELIAAAKKEGGAVKKKEETHRLAEANKAFAHFRW